MGILEGLVARFLWFAGEVAARPIMRRVFGARPAKGWSSRLDRQFSGEFKVLKDNCREIILHSEGEYISTEELKSETAKSNTMLLEKNLPNDPHAILSREPNWFADPVNIYYKTLNFDAIVAMRNSGVKPEIIGAGFLIICRETEELLLHNRAKISDTFGERWHIFGGGYMPKVSDRQDYDRLGLLSTAIRELHEETQIGISRDVPFHCIISKELSTGFIQVVYLGANISKKAIEENQGNWEGDIERVSFNNLPALLDQEEKWVPSGRALVLAWLALDAPYAGWRPRFNGLSAKQLFSRCVP